VLLRPQIDDLLAAHQDLLHDLNAEPGMLIPAQTVMHILLLQLLYSVPSEQQLYEQLNYNLLFRWFVGLGLNQKVWASTSSVATSPRCSTSRVRCCSFKIIGEVFCGALLQMPEFSLNFALLHTWLGKHSGAPRQSATDATTRRATAQQVIANSGGSVDQIFTSRLALWGWLLVTVGAQPAFAEEAAENAAPQRLVDVNEYFVRGKPCSTRGRSKRRCTRFSARKSHD
jgi:transposase